MPANISPARKLAVLDLGSSFRGKHSGIGFRDSQFGRFRRRDNRRGSYRGSLLRARLVLTLGRGIVPVLTLVLVAVLARSAVVVVAPAAVAVVVVASTTA